jgi:hypothetical protein
MCGGTRTPAWQKHVVVSGIKSPINAAVYDVDDDGIPEIALAHDFSNVYRASVGTVSILTHTNDTDWWSKTPLDKGGMAGAGCEVADLNGDRRPDVICIRTATANLKWYENRP